MQNSAQRHNNEQRRKMLVAAAQRSKIRHKDSNVTENMKVTYKEIGKLPYYKGTCMVCDSELETEHPSEVKLTGKNECRVVCPCCNNLVDVSLSGYKEIPPSLCEIDIVNKCQASKVTESPKANPVSLGNTSICYDHGDDYKETFLEFIEYLAFLFKKGYKMIVINKKNPHLTSGKVIEHLENEFGIVASYVQEDAVYTYLKLKYIAVV